MEVASARTMPPLDTADAAPVRRKRSLPSRSPSPVRHPRRRTRSPYDDPRERSPYHGRQSPDRRRRDRSDSRPRDNSYRPGGAQQIRDAPLPRDIDFDRARERKRQLEMRQPRQTEASRKLPTEEEKQAAAQKEFNELLNKRSGGVYIPPARLRALQAQITDKASKEYQRMHWDALKKAINGLINKVNIGNIKFIVPELFNENLIRGRGLFCRSIQKAQAASLPFTPIFAATAAIVNTKLPNVGELLIKRLISSFRKGFKRNDKAVAISTSTFLAQLCNQQVLNELTIAQMLLLLLHQPTNDSVEIAVNLMKEVGQHMDEFNAAISVAVFDQFRNILHEATDLEKRTLYMIEVLFQVRKDKYKDYPAVREELDLVEEEDQITHNIDLDDTSFSTEDMLNVFKFDSSFEENEAAYSKLKAEILGEVEGSDEEDDDESDESSDDEEVAKDRELEIRDQTNTDLVNLRRSIYLTIKSSGIFEEAVHKLMKINLPGGLEDELPSMIIECASQERTYEKFYGQIAERFCKLNRMWNMLFEGQFAKYFETIHRYETNRLRIIAQLFGHLLSTDAIGWHVLSIVHLNQEETTSSSRIFIKILFEELSLALGMNRLVQRMKEDTLQPALAGLFPKDDPKNTRFAINYFTAIQMGALTEDMRDWLQNMPKPALAALPEPESDSDSDSVSSYSSYSSRSRSRSMTPPRRFAEPRHARRSRSRSASESRSPSSQRERAPRGRSSSYSSRSRSYTRSRSPSRAGPRRGAREDTRSLSRSRSPPRRRARSSPSYSRSPPRRRARSPSDGRSVSPPWRRGVRDRSETPPRRQHSPPRGRRNTSSAASDRGNPPRRRRNSSSPDSRDSRSPPRRATQPRSNGYRA